jgi:hypothetical protein
MATHLEIIMHSAEAEQNAEIIWGNIYTLNTRRVVVTTPLS